MSRLARFSNNATSRLAANLSAVGLTATVTPGDGSKFPSLSAGQYFMATLIKSDGTKEIVKVTSRSTDTLTIVRAAEAVAGVQAASAFSAGDKVELRLTAGGLSNELDRLDLAALTRATTKSANYAVLEADISTLIRVDTSGGARTITLPLISSLTDAFEIVVTKITADVNLVNVTPSGSDTINGGAGYSLSSAFQSAWVIADRSTNTWTAINSGTGGTAPVVDAFVGAGAAGPFTLSGDPVSKNNTAVYVGGVYQQKSTYTLAGTALTLGGTVAVGVPVEVAWSRPVALGGTSDDLVVTAPAPGSLWTTVRGFIAWMYARYTEITGQFGSSLVGFIQLGAGAVAGNVQAELRRVFTPIQFGAVGDATTDDTASLIAMFNAAPSNSIIDLCGLSYSIHNSVSGTVGPSDAVALSGVVRLAGKSNITIRNGSIFVYNPSVSGALKRFPSTLAIDGCTNITLLGVNLSAKGELWGDSDASLPLSADQRRAFLAQNGGHALVVTRSRGVYGLNCKFLLAGSVASFYSASSHDVALTACYASPQSLGYAAYAADSWCGAVAVSGFPRHEMVLNNCRTDNNGATYGSKGGLFAEDDDVTVWVFGGVWADCYANGSSNFIGAAFASVNAKVYVNGAQVRNCAAIGLTYHSAAGDTRLECTGVVASDLRTSMHINANNSFGNSYVSYRGCYARYAAVPSLWGSAELSQLTIVANQKVTSVFNIDLLDCDVAGPKYGSWNTRACYGGIRVFDGRYEVQDQFFKSLGWGGSVSGTKRGFEVLGGTRISVTSASATSAINDVTNLDGSSVSTYLYVDMDDSVVIDSAKYRNAENFADTTGGTLTDRLRTLAKLIGCGSANAATGPSSFKVISKDGVFGGNYRLTVSYPNNRPALGVAFDDAQVVRAGLSYQSAPSVGASVTQAQINVSGTGTSWTVGVTYPQIAN